MGGLAAGTDLVSLKLEITCSVGSLTPRLCSVAQTMIWPAATMDI